MSREPESSQMRYAQSNGGWDSGVKPEPPPPPKPPKRKIRVIVEPVKPKPPAPVPKRRQERPISMNEAAFKKLVSTTEALTAEERKIIRGYRLSAGGPAADEARREIEIEIHSEREARRR